jgi:hypothetical protein
VGQPFEDLAHLLHQRAAETFVRNMLRSMGHHLMALEALRSTPRDAPVRMTFVEGGYELRVTIIPRHLIQDMPAEPK